LREVERVGNAASSLGVEGLGMRAVLSVVDSGWKG
jgi:hypothetical protein